MSKIEVGKLCMCIKTHPDGIVKKGDINEVQGIKKMVCGCTVVNVGKYHSSPLGQKMINDCQIHGMSGEYPNDGPHWLHVSRFAPIEPMTETEINEVLDRILEKDEVNQ